MTFTTIHVSFSASSAAETFAATLLSNQALTPLVVYRIENTSLTETKVWDGYRYLLAY